MSWALAGLIALAGVVGAVLFVPEAKEPEGGDRGERSASEVELPDVEQVAARVEHIRGLDFEEVPSVRVLSEQELEEEVERESEEGLSPAEREQVEREERTGSATEDLIKLIGLIEEDEELADFGGEAELGGVYDFDGGDIRLIEETVEDPVAAETTLAHELTHALEDQHFDVDPKGHGSNDEESISFQALQEGSATIVELEYAISHFGLAGPPARHLTSENFQFGSGDVPPVLRAAAAFPYLGGGRFVDALLRRERGRRLLDEAQRRPPVTTEQILHPEKWISRERGQRVRSTAADALEDDWRLVAAEQLGEFDTLTIVSLGGPRRAAREAAAGWGGGRWELWRERGERCERPCREHSVAVLMWRWDEPDEAAELARLIPPYLDRALDGEPRGGATFELDDGGYAAGRASREVTVLALAPTRELATAAARAAASP